jgi:hypothetical protein
MRQPIPLKLGDVLELRKGHPCGVNRWEVIRVGMDIRVKCQGCGRSVLLPRDRLERGIKRFLSGGHTHNQGETP